MDRRGHVRRQRGVDELAAPAADAEVAADHRLGGRRAETDEDARLDHRDLGVEPGPARDHLAPRRLLVDPALPARLPLEVLDDVRDVGGRAVDPGLAERTVEELPRGADERRSGTVLLV